MSSGGYNAMVCVHVSVCAGPFSVSNMRLGVFIRTRKLRSNLFALLFSLLSLLLPTGSLGPGVNRLSGLSRGQEQRPFSFTRAQLRARVDRVRARPSDASALHLISTRSHKHKQDLDIHTHTCTYMTQRKSHDSVPSATGKCQRGSVRDD